MRFMAMCLSTVVLGLSAGLACAEQVGEIGVDWFGNDIIVEAIKDPKVDGVTCHVSYFERGVVDRLQKGNWFEDPSGFGDIVQADRTDHHPRHQPGREWRGSVQARHQPDLEEAGREPHL